MFESLCLSESKALQRCLSLGRKISVRPVRRLFTDGVSYHKVCFKCSHCRSTIKLSNFSSMEGVVYYKPHFEQLFKESGNFNKSFQSPTNSAEKPARELTGSPGKASRMFSGTVDKCATSGKTAYPLEKLFKEKGSYNHLIKFASTKRGAAVSVPEQEA